MSRLDSVLKSLEDFAGELDSFCTELRDRTLDDRVRLILYHIARWKRRILATARCLTAAEAAEFESCPMSAEDLALLSERVFADAYVATSAGKTDLLDSVVGVLEVLVSYFEWLLTQPLGANVKGIFQKLLDQQLEEIDQLKKLSVVPGL